MDVTPSQTCTTLIAGFEGFSAVAYEDGGGVLTIGFGHTEGVQPGDTCTREQALEWLAEDMQGAADAVNLYVTVPLNQNQFDALVSFCYNVGSGNFQKSTLLKELNGGDYLGCAAQFQQWDLIHGVVSNGLLNRRIAERNLFMEAV